MRHFLVKPTLSNIYLQINPTEALGKNSNIKRLATPKKKQWIKNPITASLNFIICEPKHGHTQTETHKITVISKHCLLKSLNIDVFNSLKKDKISRMDAKIGPIHMLYPRNIALYQGTTSPWHKRNEKIFQANVLRSNLI